MEEKRNEAYRVGVGVMILLAVLTIGEYFLGSVASAWWAPLLLIALMKAFFVLRDYMHVGRLFSEDEEAHS